MRCAACGAENPPGARFCNGCGAPLIVVCTNCGHRNPPASRFCNECGSPQSATNGAREPDPAEPSAPSPRRYTPRHLAEKILAGRDALQGERKQVTVLFADVVGSTELIRDHDPEDAQRLLDGAVQRMMDAVHRYEGTVSRLMGDGLMALFGAPVAHEDHALRACHAALAMLDAIRSSADESRRSSDAPVQIRVGINSGEVIVRLISDDLHMDYTAMGQTVHLAARMEAAADAGVALLTPSTLALVEGFVDVRSLGSRTVKGFAEPLLVYELVGAGTARTRFQATTVRGLTPFVGRHDERIVIDHALARADSGRGQIAALVGEPGIGKSRLVYEVSQRAATLGWLVLASGAVSYGTATPYLAVVDLLRAYARIQPGDDAEMMRERVTSRVLELDPTFGAMLTPLLSLLDLPIIDASWADLDPARRRRATLDAVRGLLLRESQRQPLLVVVEDLHWIDSETQALLDEMVETVPSARMVLLVNYRPEYTHRWASQGAFSEVRIDALAADTAERFLDSRLGEGAALAPLKRHLIERTGGNPLFLEESIRSLIEAGVLIGGPGSHVLAEDVLDFSVPRTIQAILAARIDRLDPDAKRLLQTAAVIGKDVPFDLLQVVAEVPAETLRVSLSRLQAAELLYPIRLRPEAEYTFKHALTHDVAYASLLRERRTSLHNAVVAGIERLYSDRLDENVERLAHHALQGELWARALDYLRRAATRAMGRSAYREGVAHLERALVALGHLPEDRGRLEQAVDIRLDLRTCLWPYGDAEAPARVLRYLKEAEEIAQALADTQRLGRVSVLTCVSLNRAGQHHDAVDAGRRALSLGAASEDVGLRAVSDMYLSLALGARNDYRLAIEHGRRAVALLTDDLLYDRLGSVSLPSVLARGYLATSLAEVGAFVEAARIGDEAIQITDTTDHPVSRLNAYWTAGVGPARQGDTTRAIPLLERAVSMCRDLGLPIWLHWTLPLLGVAYVQDGRLADGIALLEAIVEQDRVSSFAAFQAQAVAWLGEAYLSQGRLQDATSQAAAALNLARERYERGHEAMALRLLGDIAAHRTPEDAEANLRESLALASDLGMRPLQARCHLGLGRHYGQIGRLHQARVELSMAVSMVREMGMVFWLPDAEAELAEVVASVPGEAGEA